LIKVSMEVAVMTSRERVAAAIEHRAVDSVPLMLWLEPHTTLKMAVHYQKPRRLTDKLAIRWIDRMSHELPTEELRNGVPLLTYLIHGQYLRELGADIVETQWSPAVFLPRGFWLEKGKMRFKDFYGITRAIGGIYMEHVDVPCKTKEDLDHYRFPDASNPLHYLHIRAYRGMNPDVAILGWCPGVQDYSQSWHTIEQLYIGMIEYPDTTKRFFAKMTDHTLQIIRGMMKAGADMIMIGDDYGNQRSLMMSKAMWEEFTYPCLKRQIETIHKYGGKALLHSCGTVAPLLDRFVEAGLDALHPFQPLPGNNLEEAKKEFGDHLAFCTGIDVQKIPEMTPEEVREDIIRVYSIAGQGGGLVLATTNALQYDTPIENIRAMFKTIKDIQSGKIKI
ncbi:MAG: uroporphyrinogen decarboxylase family protein, partial [bacterium]